MMVMRALIVRCVRFNRMRGKDAAELTRPRERMS